MDMFKILGILIKDRIKEAGKTQKVLTANNHLIASRMGFHEVNTSTCSRMGMIILQLIKEWTMLEKQVSDQV